MLLAEVRTATAVLGQHPVQGHHYHLAATHYIWKSLSKVRPNLDLLIAQQKVHVLHCMVRHQIARVC